MQKTRLLVGLAEIILTVTMAACTTQQALDVPQELAPSREEGKEKTRQEVLPTGYKVRYPIDMHFHWQEGDYSHIKILDYSGQDISEITIDLWYCASAVYSEEKSDTMFQTTGSEVHLEGYRVQQSLEILNYQEVVEDIFTPAGIAQLEQASLGGEGNLIIRREDGKIYHIAPYKTGLLFAYALSDMKAVEVTEDKIVLEAECTFHRGEPDVGPWVCVCGFTIVNVDEKWLVESYSLPQSV